MAARNRGIEAEAEKASASRAPKLGVVVLSVCFVAVVATQWQGRQTWQAVDVKGASELSRGAVDSTLAHVVGKEMTDVSFAELRERLLAIPYLSGASVFQKTSNHLGVIVSERIPVAFYIAKNGSVAMVDAEGMMLPAGRKVGAQCLPVLRRKDGATLTKADAIGLARFVQIVPSAMGQEMATYVSEVVLDVERDEVIVVTDGAQWRLRWSQTEHLHAALLDAAALVSSGALANAQNAYMEFDLRWKGQVVVRTVQHSGPLT